MSQENERTDREARTVGEVERIRDILFGPQMRRYEQQFKRMTAQLDLLGKQVEGFRVALDQQRAEQEAHTRQLQQDLHQRYGQLGQLESTFEQRHAELTAQVRDLAAELRQQGQDLRSEFTTALHDLEDNKASRHDLGDLLIEMGTRLKEQMGLADLLGQLEGAAEDQILA